MYYILTKSPLIMILAFISLLVNFIPDLLEIMKGMKDPA